MVGSSDTSISLDNVENKYYGSTVHCALKAIVANSQQTFKKMQQILQWQ